MQPRDIQYLEHILDYCDEIAHDLTAINSSYDTFLTDSTVQRSLAFCIVQIGELCGKLSGELRSATINEIDWAAIKAMRNIVVHDYGNIDLDQVWNVAISDAPTLKVFCEAKLPDE